MIKDKSCDHCKRIVDDEDGEALFLLVYERPADERPADDVFSLACAGMCGPCPVCGEDLGRLLTNIS